MQKVWQYHLIHTFLSLTIDPKPMQQNFSNIFFSSICSKTLDYFLLSFSVEAFQAIAQNWSHPLLTDNAVISDLCDKERRYGGFTMFQKCQKHSQIMHHIDRTKWNFQDKGWGQKYSRLRCLLPVKGLVICLIWDYLALLF